MINQVNTLDINSIIKGARLRLMKSTSTKDPMTRQMIQTSINEINGSNLYARIWEPIMNKLQKDQENS